MYTDINIQQQEMQQGLALFLKWPAETVLRIAVHTPMLLFYNLMIDCGIKTTSKHRFIKNCFDVVVTQHG